MTYAEFLAILGTAGHKIAAPTEQNVAMPCFTVEPIGMEMSATGAPVVFEIATVTARTAMGEGDLGNWDAGRQMLYDAIRAFMGTKVGFEPEMQIASNVNTSPASLTATMTVAFPGEDIC